MTKARLKQLREEFLTDTLQYYTTDPKRRCIDVARGQCFYSPENAGKVGISEGCAIGRHITNSLALILDGSMTTAVSSEVVFEQLPLKLRKLQKFFLSDVQSLHDRKENWSKNGLTRAGKRNVKTICKNYGLSVDAKYLPK